MKKILVNLLKAFILTKITKMARRKFSKRKW